MAGKMKNCPICGKIFLASGMMRVCRDCQAIEQEMEAKVIEYVRDNPNCTIPEIVRETGASDRLIRRMIQEGRFEQTGVSITYPCEKCGAPITAGKLCQSCTDSLRTALQETHAKTAAKAQAAKGKGMYSKDKMDSKDRSK